MNKIMNKIMNAFLIVTSAVLLCSCSLFTPNESPEVIISRLSQTKYNSLSPEQKAWLKFYCDSDDINSAGVQRRLRRHVNGMFNEYISSHSDGKLMQHQFRSYYKYMQSHPHVSYPHSN